MSRSDQNRSSLSATGLNGLDEIVLFGKASPVVGSVVVVKNRLAFWSTVSLPLESDHLRYDAMDRAFELQDGILNGRICNHGAGGPRSRPGLQ